MSAITLENVSLSFAAKPQPFTVLEDINLTLDKGEFVVLLGLRAAANPPFSTWSPGLPNRTAAAYWRAANRCAPGPDRGMIFQQPNLFPWLSVLDNVTFGPRLGRYQKEEVNARALDWLNRWPERFEQHAPWQLSGGMKQRVALARAWLPGPEVLLLDEPFGALDAQTRLMMQELLREAWLTTGTTLLFVTHDVEEALFLADRILVMSAKPGKIVEEIVLPLAANAISKRWRSTRVTAKSSNTFYTASARRRNAI
jgi:NitT/TauT family transport system ATP-binding protein